MTFFSRHFPYRLNCKVISVGNITLGGTGKTSLVEFVARYLKQRGHKVAILTRGYKRKTSNFELRTSNYETMGDEPCMLLNKLGDIPVIVDADRIRGAKRAIEEHSADTVILDDGFQQWRIIKNLEIVAIDTTNPFGNRHMIPRGILREPLSSLKRADIFVLTKTNLGKDVEAIRDYLSKLNPESIIIESQHLPIVFYNINNPEEVLNIDILKGKSAALFSGIGDPASFENTVAGLGIKPALTFRFIDHHRYTKEDLDKIFAAAQEKNINTVITTEKDAVRLAPRQAATGNRQIFVLRIELKVTKNEDELCSGLLKLYSL